MIETYDIEIFLKKRKKVDLPGIELTAGEEFHSEARRSTILPWDLTHQMRVKIKVINSAFNHIMRVYKPAQILFFVHENPYPKKLFLFFSQNISTFFYIKNYVPNVVCCIQCRLLCCLLNVECCISMLRHMLRHWTV